MSFTPLASIIINTDGRVGSLRTTLQSLRHLHYPNFEVVVVAGPTQDGTHELLEEWAAVKIAQCPERNLARSRNIGIAASSGEVLAFIDDDAIPEPEWLADVVSPFVDRQVGISGGFVHDHTGAAYQWRFGTVNRLAAADETWRRPAAEYNFPFSYNVPHVIGTNSAFRRAAVLDVGGFDEEFDYYLDETDLICRIVDQGWHVAQLDRAFIHHKFLQSHLRNQHRFLTRWYAIVKNKTYFCRLHASAYLDEAAISNEINSFVERLRKDMRWAVDNGLLPRKIGQNFEEEVKQALKDGKTFSLREQTRLPNRSFLVGDIYAFKPFPTLRAESQPLCIVFVTQDFPPEPVGGIGRYVCTLASEIARLGHQVHVLTRGKDHDRVDFEDGVWVHRLSIGSFEQSTSSGEKLPSHIWNYSMTMLGEAKKINQHRPVVCVHAPLWDVEGIAFARDGSLPLITSLHTTLSNYLDADLAHRNDAHFMTDFAGPVLGAELELLTKSDGLLANSHAIVSAIEQSYRLTLDKERVRVVPRGMQDWTQLPRAAPKPLPKGSIRLVFIGRLEARKGIEALLDAAAHLLQDAPHVYLDLVGNDRIPGPGGTTWRSIFEARHCAQPWFARVCFHGEVSEEALRGFYHAAAIVLAPSLFESFGLVHLEAMMFSRPIIGCRAGGMLEVVEDGVTGLLAEPGNAQSLTSSIERLIASPELRERLGSNGRKRYLERFNVDRMVADEIDFIRRVAGRPPNRALATPVFAGPRAVLAQDARKQGPGAVTKRKKRVAIIASVVARFDAISDSVVKTFEYLSQDSRWDVSVLASRSDFETVPVRVVSGAGELLKSLEFLDADLLVYHFGVWHPLFDSMNIGNGHAKIAVVFHNITPTKFVPAKAWNLTRRSFDQLHNLVRADRLWPVSQANSDLLLDMGFDRDKIEILPLAVDRPPISQMAGKSSDEIELVYVGRMVAAKGVVDLVDALDQIGTQKEMPRFRLRLLGNLEYSDPDYCDLLHKRISQRTRRYSIEFLGTVEDSARDRILTESHILAIPSFHEGFCKPVVEALRAGAIPVGYAAYNLKYIYEGVGRMVEPGNVSALSQALSSVICDVAAALQDSTHPIKLDAGHLTIAGIEEASTRIIARYEPAAIAMLIRHKTSDILEGAALDQRAQELA